MVEGTLTWVHKELASRVGGQRFRAVDRTQPAKALTLVLAIAKDLTQMGRHDVIGGGVGRNKGMEETERQGGQQRYMKNNGLINVLVESLKMLIDCILNSQQYVQQPQSSLPGALAIQCQPIEISAHLRYVYTYAGVSYSIRSSFDKTAPTYLYMCYVCSQKQSRRPCCRRWTRWTRLEFVHRLSGRFERLSKAQQFMTQVSVIIAQRRLAMPTSCPILWASSSVRTNCTFSSIAYRSELQKS